MLFEIKIIRFIKNFQYLLYNFNPLKKKEKHTPCKTRIVLRPKNSQEDEIFIQYEKFKLVRIWKCLNLYEVFKINSLTQCRWFFLCYFVTYQCCQCINQRDLDYTFAATTIHDLLLMHLEIDNL